MNETDSNDNWAFFRLLIWTAVALGAMAGIVHLVGHLIFKLW